MATLFADHTYRNANDTVRFRIRRYARGQWDVDVFSRHPSPVVRSLSDDGETFMTKAAALAHVQSVYGKVSRFSPRSMTEGWL